VFLPHRALRKAAEIVEGLLDFQLIELELEPSGLNGSENQPGKVSSVRLKGREWK